MPRTALVFLVTLALASSAHAACALTSWNPKWFPTEAIHYTAGDLDRDGVSDIISASTTTVSWRRAPQLADVPIYTAGLIGAPAAADVNGDGKTDLVIPNDGDGTLVVLPGNGNGTFGSAVISPLPFPPVRFVVGNFSGGAHADVALIGTSAALYFLEGDGTGAFTLAGSMAIQARPRHLVTANFDGDAYDDVAVSHAGSNLVSVAFPNGSGAPSALTVDGGAAALLGAADYDADGDLDLYAVRASHRRLDVLPNDGARTFGPAASQTQLWNEWLQTPRSMALADFNNDGHTDVALAHPGFLLTHLRTPQNIHGVPWGEGSWIHIDPPAVTDNLRSIAAADFTGDGRVDFAVENAAAGHGGLLVNQCTPVLAVMWVQPVLSIGQTARATATLHPPAGQSGPTGTARLIWNGGEQTLPLIELGSASYAMTTIAGLPLGFQPVVLEYDGDSRYPPATSTAWTTVTSATTTTTITGPTRWAYGERPTFHAVVTSSTGDTPTGEIEFMWQGHKLGQTGQAPAAEAQTNIIPPGTHTVTAELISSKTHPLSSGSLEVTVDRASSTLRFIHGAMSRAGQPATITVLLQAQPPGPLTGTVRLMEGAATVATLPLDAQTTAGQFLQIPVHGLAPGVHTFRAVWDGDANVAGSSSAEFQHTVHPAGAPLLLVATGTKAYVMLDFLPLAANVPHGVYRRAASGSWVYLGSTLNSRFFDGNVTPGRYEYQVRATVDGSEVVSNIATASVGSSRRRSVRR